MIILSLTALNLCYLAQNVFPMAHKLTIVEPNLAHASKLVKPSEKDNYNYEILKYDAWVLGTDSAVFSTLYTYTVSVCKKTHIALHCVEHSNTYYINYISVSLTYQ